MFQLKRRGSLATALVLPALFLAAGCGDDADDEADEAVAEQSSVEAPAPAPTPPAAPAAAGAEGTATLGSTLANDPQLTVFARVLEASRLGSELQGETVTIFAPNNAAFSASAVPEESVAGEGNARSFVLRHTVNGTHDSAALEGMTQLRPREGGVIALRTADGRLMVGDGEVLRTLRARNATIHVISRVIAAGG